MTATNMCSNFGGFRCRPPFKLTFRALPCVLNVLRVKGLIGRVNEVALVYDNVMIVHP